MGLEIKRNGKRVREAYTRLAEEGQGGNQLLQTPCSGKSLFKISSKYVCETREKLVLLWNFVCKINESQTSLENFPAILPKMSVLK
jgi:hypothetical protein